MAGSTYRTVKRMLDFCLAVIALVLLSPLFALIALMVKLDSKGPAAFKQIRVGHKQKEFTFYKFRSMVKDAEKQLGKVKHLDETDGPVFKAENDPRLTKLGKILRRSNLDELPQLWNVLKGDMALVGFRPPLPSEVKHYNKWQLKRFEGKPGMTSLWAVSGAHKMSFDEWIKLDIWYNEHASLRLDLSIIWKTAKNTLRHLL